VRVDIYVCVCERERERECVCVCVREEKRREEEEKREKRSVWRDVVFLPTDLDELASLCGLQIAPRVTLMNHSLLGDL